MRLEPFVWDQAVFTAVNRWGRDALDYFCAWPTHFGDPAILIVLVAAFLLIWEDGPVFKKIWLVAFATAAGWLAAQASKDLVFRPRPYPFYRELIESGGYQINALFELLMQESSFPSGHTATAFACITALNWIYKNKLWPLYLFGIFVGFTRVYVGVHFPSDVIAGAAIGVLSGLVACRAVEAVQSRISGTKQSSAR